MMDVFDKTKGLKLVSLLKRVNLYPYFRALTDTKGSRVVFQENELVMLGSNNYLGLTHHPEVIQAGIQALEKWGSGCTGSRFLNGNLSLHEELEIKLADFLGYDSALVLATGFMANQGAISALVGKNEYILSDFENHACIIEGCRLSGAKTVVYAHNNMLDLEEKLKSLPKRSAKLIITDGVFSMTGHISNFPKIAELAKKYNARTYIDDAHGLGTIGEGGRGSGSFHGLKADLMMGTFSKSFASQGGFICGRKDVINWIKHKSRTFMFSAALSPASVACVLKSLEILKREPELVAKVNKNAKYLKKGLDALGLNTLDSATCILPILVGDDKVALKVCMDLLKLGVFATPVVYPAVPKNNAVIRCSVMANHTTEELEVGIQAFAKLAPTILKANRSKSNYALHAMLGDKNPSLDNIDQKSKKTPKRVSLTPQISSSCSQKSMKENYSYFFRITSNLKSWWSSYSNFKR